LPGLMVDSLPWSGGKKTGLEMNNSEAGNPEQAAGQAPPRKGPCRGPRGGALLFLPMKKALSPPMVKKAMGG